MVLDSGKARKALNKKGFTERSGDHIYFEYFHNNKLILHTKISHNGQDINNYLIGQMKNQCKLEKDEFLALINCTLSKEGYEKKLQDQGLLK